jgi:predicted DNA-binding ribbon-helix-helix protein
MNPKRRRGAQKRSLIAKRSLRINGSNTTVTLEDTFWNALREIAAARHMHVSELISTIKIERQPGSNLSSTIRLFILDYYQRSVRWRPTRSARPVRP